MGGLEPFGEHLFHQLVQAVNHTISQKPIIVQKSNYSYNGNEEIIENVLNSCDILGRQSLTSYRSNFSPPRVFIVESANGGGRTAFLSQLCNILTEQGCIVLYSFVRSWIGSFNVNYTIRRFCLKLMYKLKITFEILPSEYEELKAAWVTLMRKAVSLGNIVVILIDGLDRMKDEHNRNAGVDLNWMPRPSELGSDAFRNTVWILSTGDERTHISIQELHSHAGRIILPEVSEQCKRNFISEECHRLNIKLEAKQIDELIQKKASNSLIYIELLLKEAQRKWPPILELNYMNETDLFISILRRLESKCGADHIKNLFSYLSLSRNGLREVELIGLMKINSLKWNLIFRYIETYISKTPTGFVMLSKEQYSAIIRSSYTSKELATKLHKNLAIYYMKMWETEKLQRSTQLNSIRIIDVPYHLFNSNAPLKDIINILCNLDYIMSAFEQQAQKEMETFFKKAIVMASKNELSEMRRLTEFNIFIEKNSIYLKCSPKLTFTLALDMPKGMCVSVKNEALNQLKNKFFEVFFRNITENEDQLEMAAMGSHSTAIVYSGVHHFSKLGKYCLTVSQEGTSILWNLETLLKERLLIDSPLGDFDKVVHCAVSMSGCDLIAMGTVGGHFIIFNAISGRQIIQLDHQYFGGRFFFSENSTGIWRIYKRRLTFISISGSNTNAQKTNINIKLGYIIATSWDFNLIAIMISGESKGVTILSAKTMHEICHFKEPNISEMSIGSFSYLKDTIAITLITGDIMVPKIYNIIALENRP